MTLERPTKVRIKSQLGSQLLHTHDNLAQPRRGLVADSARTRRRPGTDTAQTRHRPATCDPIDRDATPARLAS